MPRFAAMVALVAFGPLAARADPREGVAFFEAHVRPLLTERCVSCHGPTAQKGGLRLDSAAALRAGGDGGAVLHAGRPDRSRLIQAVRHTDDDLKMPPSGKLPPAAIAALEKWVAIGAPWPKQVMLVPPSAIGRAARTHWAFQPVRKPTVPTPKDTHWPRTAIDRFVLARLEAAGLAPSPEADRRTLIRRATFDLTGLPPTPDEVAAFEADQSPDAYERLIDRLLASPRYGERWARHWLDVARYADNKGYVFFEDKKYPWAWAYRDYVIAAFIRDVPYNQFIVEQLAADLLPQSEPKTLAALGFLTVGGHFMNNTHDIIDDRIDVVTRGLLGLTVTCARCHDHKFDPIPQADYYSLYGVFRSCTEPTVPPLLGPAPDTDEYRKFARELDQRVRKLVDFVTVKHHRLVTQARARAAEYLLAAHAARGQPPADDFMLLADPGDLNPAMITRWRVYLEEARKRRDPVWLPWHRFAELPEKEFAQRAGAVCDTLRNEKAINPLVRECFTTKPASLKDVAARYGKLLAGIDQQWKNAKQAKRLPDPAAEELRQVLYGPRAPADAPLALDWGFLSLFPDRATQGEYQKLLKEVEGHVTKGPPRAMVLRDAARPYEPRVFLRGQPHRLGESVPRQFLRVAYPQRKPFVAGSGRLELAREIASPNNPLTARVFVNRVWLHHFGGGLVETPSDFGLRSDPPTHPRLLDWLAADFVEHGWSVKRLHKLILTSAVYRQSSNAERGVRNAELKTATSAIPHSELRTPQSVDPENRLLWRMNRRRLEFEPLHDALLAVSGSLDLTAGGPSVDLFGGSRRRAVYGRIDRLEFPTLLSTFDVPSPATSSPRRTSTTVPPQALYLMNGPFARDAAKRLVASPGVSKHERPRNKIDALFRAVYGRAPTAAERKLAREFVARGPEAERWADLAHGLLMANEFVFID